MELTKKELFDLFTKSGAVMDEVYQWDSHVKKYTESGPHGEFVSYLGGIEDSLLDDEHKYECQFWVMDENDYNGSIMAPFSPQSNFQEEYENPDAKVFIVTVDHLEAFLNNQH